MDYWACYFAADNHYPRNFLTLTARDFVATRYRSASARRPAVRIDDGRIFRKTHMHSEHHAQPMKLTRSLHLVALAAVLSFASPGFAVTYYEIYPGQQAVISFHFNGAPIADDIVPDVLVLLIGGNTPLGLIPTTYSLFDEDTLLGSVRRPGAGFDGQSFRSFDNTFRSYLYIPSVPVDFSSIRSGEIQGRLFYAPEFTNPAPGAHATIEFELYLWKQTGESTGLVTQRPTVDSIQIIPIPEPAATAILTVGFIGMFLRSRKRTARAFP